MRSLAFAFWPKAHGPRHERASASLYERGIIWIPDYVTSAGDVIYALSVELRHREGAHPPCWSGERHDDNGAVMVMRGSIPAPEPMVTHTAASLRAVCIMSVNPTHRLYGPIGYTWRGKGA